MTGKNKKADVNMIGILVLAIVAIAAGGLLLYVFRGGLSNAEKNVDMLSSCRNQGGECMASCTPEQSAIYGVGCPFDGNGNGKIDGDEPSKKTCCINKNYG